MIAHTYKEKTKVVQKKKKEERNKEKEKEILLQSIEYLGIHTLSYL